MPGDQTPERPTGSATATPGESPQPSRGAWWAERLVASGVSFFGLGSFAAIVAGICLVVGVSATGTDAVSVTDYPAVEGPTEVTMDEPGSLVLFFEAGERMPEADCQVTDAAGDVVPQGQERAVFDSVSIEGQLHHGADDYPVNAGTYTVDCDGPGFRAGPGYSTDSPRPSSSYLEGAATGAFFVSSANVLVSLLWFPLLIAGIIVRSVSRAGASLSASRRRVARAGAVSLSAGILVIPGVAGGVIWGIGTAFQTSEGEIRELASSSLGAIGVAMMYAVIAGVAWIVWRRRRRALGVEDDAPSPESPGSAT